MKIVLPFVSVLRDQEEARFPVTVYYDCTDSCECGDQGSCSKGTTRYGDEDSNSPVFCSKHYTDLHTEDGQSDIRPMNDKELAYHFSKVECKVCKGIQEDEVCERCMSHLNDHDCTLSPDSGCDCAR